MGNTTTQNTERGGDWYMGDDGEPHRILSDAEIAAQDAKIAQRRARAAAQNAEIEAAQAVHVPTDSPAQDFETCLIAFKAFVHGLRCEALSFWEDEPDTWATIKTTEMRGPSFVRIVAEGTGSSRSAYCFVALKDGENKQMGKFTRGQIFMAAGWAGPAKHARGDIFEPASYQQFTAYGPQYLR